MVGTTISHYKVLEKIGEGGMGEVYKTEDTRLGRNVSVGPSPHFSHPIYCGGKSGRVYCVTRKRRCPRPGTGALARLVSTAISTPSLRSGVRNAGQPG